MRKLAGILLLLALLLPTLSSAQAESTTTVMIYMCGSNLESQYGLASSDIEEMIASQFDADHTKVVLMASGSSDWWMAFDPSQTSICEVRPRGLVVTEILDSMNMASGDTLQFFLNYVADRYASDRYILILWDHGGGPMRGVCWDEIHNPDNLTMPELVSALQGSPFAERKLDMIGFDACLMGSLEVAWMLSPYADYMVASEEKEPGFGWNYSFLNGLEQDASMADTGRRIVDSYMASPSGELMNDLTLACVDLREAEAVSGAMSDFFYDILDQVTRASFAELSGKRRVSRGFGRDLSDYNSSGYDLVDLQSLLEQYAALSPEKGAALQEALQRAVVYSGSNVEGSNGLSVYFPFYNASSYRQTNRALYASFDFCPGYTAYVERFGSYLLDKSFTNWAGIQTQAEQTDPGALITAQLTPEQLENFASAQLVIFEINTIPGSVNDWYRKTYESLDVTLDENGRLSARYNNERLIFASRRRGTSLPYQVLDTGEYVVPAIASSTDDTADAFAAANGTYHEDWKMVYSLPIRMVYSPPNAEGNLTLQQIQVYDELTGDFTTRSDFHRSTYGTFYIWDQRRYPSRDENGVLLAFEQWAAVAEDAYGTEYSYKESYSDSWFIDLDLTIGSVPPSAWLFAAFQVTDTQNHTYTTELVPLPNDDLFIADAEVMISPAEVTAMEPYVVVTEEGDLQLEVHATNLSDKPLWYFLYVLSVNEREMAAQGDHTIGHYHPIYGLAPGETGTLYMQFFGFDFAADDRLSEISFLLLACDTEDIFADFTVDSSADIILCQMLLDVDLSRIKGRPLSLVFQPDELAPDSPCLYSQDGVSVWLNTVMVTNGHAILALTGENTGGQDTALYLSDVLFDGESGHILSVYNDQLADTFDFSYAESMHSFSQADFKPIELPAGKRVLTFVELSPKEALGQTASLSFCLHGEAELQHRTITLTLPGATALVGEPTRFAGAALGFAGAATALDHNGQRISGEVLLPDDVTQYARTVTVQLTDEQAAHEILSGELFIGTLLTESSGAQLFDTYWMLDLDDLIWTGSLEDGTRRLIFAENGNQFSWTYPGVYLAIGSGDTWVPLMTCQVRDQWTILDIITCWYGETMVASLDLSESMTLRYTPGTDDISITLNSITHQLPADALTLFMYALFEVHTEDGSNRSMTALSYPTRHSFDSEFYENKLVTFAEHPLQLALRPFDPDAQLYVIYSFYDNDGSSWSTDPIPLDP